MFFVQNAGALDAGTGLNKSSVVQKISLAEADAVRTGAHNQSEVTVTVVPSNPQVINPNGGTNYKGQLIFAGEGQGDRIASALYLMNPEEPYNTTGEISPVIQRPLAWLTRLQICSAGQQLLRQAVQFTQ